MGEDEGIDGYLAELRASPLRIAVVAVLAIALALLLPTRAAGQATYPTPAPGVRVTGSVFLLCDGNGRNCAPLSTSNALPTGVRESFALAASNAPSAPATVFGGDYILSQACTGYGTLNLQVLGPDGATWQTVLSKTASDTSGGTGMSLGSNAQVRVTVSGTTGCAAILARVPA